MKLGPIDRLMAGAMAGVTAQSLIYPLEVRFLSWQLSSIRKISERNNDLLKSLSTMRWFSPRTNR